MKTNKKATLEDAWAIIRELGESQNELRESQKETDRQLKETDRQLKESQQKTDIQLKETNRQLKESQEKTNRQIQEAHQLLSESIKQQGGNFDTKWGAFLESFVSGDLVNLLKERGIPVKDVILNAKIKRSDGTTEAEYDIIAVNGKEMVVVEVKTTLGSDDVAHFLRKLKIFRERFPKYEKNIIYGGIAYLGQAPEGDSATKYAQRSGLFLFQAPGGTNNVTIIKNDKNFRPKAF